MKRLILASFTLSLAPFLPLVADGLTFEQLAALRSVGSVELSPDGSRIAYTLTVPRRPGHDENGPARTELRVTATDGSWDRVYVSGKVDPSGIRFTPDGTMLTYLTQRDEDEHRSIWAIHIDGGESRRLLSFDTKIESYRVSPDGKHIAFLALEPESDAREKARKKGYTQEVFEEDWRPRRVWITPMPSFEPDVAAPGEEAEETEPVALELDGSAFQIEWAPDNERLAVTVAPRPLVDDRYMKQKVRVVDAKDGSTLTKLNNVGKLGRIVWSPDGKNIAMISAADPNDPKDGRLLVGSSADGGALRDLMPDLEAHVSSIAWQDDETVMFLAGTGTEVVLGEVSLGGSRTVIYTSSAKEGRPIPRSLSLSRDGLSVAFAAESPKHPSEVFFMRQGQEPQRLTDNNPWLANVDLAEQEVVRFKARDGLELEGVLVHPLNGELHAPLILMVHGGPEGHDRNGWITSYSRPAQLAAAQGYAVFYPNYRGSTGRGVAFSKLSQGDAAGAEFDDLIDAVDYLVTIGLADKDRVGITGGSYGGYATAWCSTRHTERFRAGVMFVGISNKVSKGLTTEIPIEDVMVHTRFDPWKNWQFSLERSPVYYADRSRTALLIAHGNRRAASRDDYTRRMMRWFNHFLLTDDRELPDWDLPHPWLDEEEDE
ncbi:MAG: S9 family peptidase [Acidobacteria bacterium]|nr:S9 family peptidase [Acidobacteriota bacterium]